MTRARLKQMFRSYNSRYFGGELPDYQISFGPLPYGMTGVACCDEYFLTLIFDPRQIRGERKWRCILLHEMSHILARPGHGGTFADQLCRCPKYAILYECGGNRDSFALLMYGPRRAHRAAKRIAAARKRKKKSLKK